jgi:hypothetical protein
VIRGDAARGTATTAPSGFIGAWRVNPTIGGQTAVALTTFNADGTVFTSNRPVQTAPAGVDLGAPVIVQSLGHGSWTGTGERTADMTFVILQSDPVGAFLGTRTIRGSLELNERGDQWTGTFSATIADAVGTEFVTQVGSVEATRIVIEPIAPAMTPVVLLPPALADRAEIDLG